MSTWTYQIINFPEMWHFLKFLVRTVTPPNRWLYSPSIEMDGQSSFDVFARLQLYVGINEEFDVWFYSMFEKILPLVY